MNTRSLNNDSSTVFLTWMISVIKAGQLMRFECAAQYEGTLNNVKFVDSRPLICWQRYLRAPFREHSPTSKRTLILDTKMNVGIMYDYYLVMIIIIYEFYSFTTYLFVRFYGPFRQVKGSAIKQFSWIRLIWPNVMRLARMIPAWIDR